MANNKAFTLEGFKQLLSKINSTFIKQADTTPTEMLDIDTIPALNSNNLITSGGVYNYHDNTKSDTTHSHDDRYYTETEVDTLLTTKQNTIDSSHKLSSDLLEDGLTNKTVTQVEKTAWSGKSTVSVASTGAATDEIQYITIDGIEKKIAGGDSEFAIIKCTTNHSTCTSYENAYTELVTNGKKPIIEITQANSAEKAKYFYPTFWRFNNSTSRFEFYIEYSHKHYVKWYITSVDSYWTDEYQSTLLDTDNIVTQINSGSVDTKTPSAKATYDTIQANKIKVQQTAPDNPQIGDVWIDTSIPGDDPTNVSAMILEHNNATSAHSNIISSAISTHNSNTNAHSYIPRVAANPTVTTSSNTLSSISIDSNSYKIGTNWELIWTNSDTSVAFPQTEVTIDLSKYNFILIDFLSGAGGTGHVTQIAKVAGGGSYTAQSIGGNCITRRAYYVYSNKINFNIATQMSTYGTTASQNNDYVIPYKIYGIR